MLKALSRSVPIAFGLTLIVGLGCGGSGNPNPDAKGDAPKDSGTGKAGTGGGAGTGGAGTMGTAGTGGAGTMGTAGTGAAGTGAAGTGAAGTGAAGTGAAGTGAAGTGAAGTGAAGTGAAGTGAAGTGAAGTGAAGTGAAGTGAAGTGAAGTGAAGTGAAGTGSAGTGGAGQDGGAGTGAAAGTTGAAGTDAGTDSGSDGGDAACTNACTLNATRCAGGGVETCVNNAASGCTVWGTAAACGAHQTCAVGGGGVAACACNATTCTANGDFCSSGTEKSTCATDAQGCMFVSAGPVACPTHQSCTGAAGSATCSCNTDPNCASGTATFCASGTSKSTCGTDANGCFYVVSTDACPAHQACTGSNPNGTCGCVAPPADCAGGAGSFCATSTSVSTCQVDGNNCVFVSGTASCGTHQSCSGGAGVGACGCNAPPAGCAAVGDFCDNGASKHCAQDSDSCFFVSNTVTCGARQTCNAGTGACECNAAPTGCGTPGPFCDSNGKVSACAQDGNGCFFINGTPATCGTNQTCTGGAGAAACSCNTAPAICANGAAGTYCSSGTETTTCAADSDGCVIVTGTHACGPLQTCQGGSNAKSCVCNTPPAGCTAAGTFCPDANHVSTCAADSDSCLDVTATTACPTHQTCKGAGIGQTCTCDNTCDAGKAGGLGTYCIDTKTQSSCANDGNGCFIKSANTTCPGTMTCQGADGNGFCQCQAVGLTLGTGCTTPGATLCGANDTVMTCTQDLASACLTWVESRDCKTDTLVCGTAAGVAGCQCGAHTGNDFFVDAFEGTDSASGVFPTGNQFPKNCRFGTLGKGLSLAGSGQRVVATSEAGIVSMDFASETFPLTVPAGVTVTTSEGIAQTGKYIVHFDGGAGGGFIMGSNSVLEALEIVNAGGSGSATLVSVPGTNVTIDSVILEGTGGTVLNSGISVSGAGQALVTGATVDGFVTGVSVASSSGLATTLASSTVSGNSTGLAVSNGTLTTTSSTVNANTVGVAISAAASALSTLNGTSLTVSNSGGLGISQSASGGTAALNLTSGDVHHNNGGGISVSSGTATIGAVQVHDNAASTGITLSTAGTSTITGATVSSNGSSGIAQSAGTLTISGSTVSSNATTGITVTGGTLTIGTTSVTGNTTDGLQVAAGTVAVGTGAKFDSNMVNGINITGSVTMNTTAATPISASSNKANGINIGAGNLTASYLTLDGNGAGGTGSGLKVSGAAVVNLGSAGDSVLNITNNGLDGINVAAASAGSNVSVTRATVKSNGTVGVANSAGIFVDLNGGTTAAAAGITVSSSSILSNNGSGIEIARAPQGAGVTKANFDLLTISSNTGAGVFYRGTNGTTAGNVAATLTNSKVSLNGGVGVRVEQTGANTTQEALQGDDITGNAGGGVAFNTASTLTSFQANKVHSNTGDQIVVSSRQNVAATPWPFRSVGNTCDANANQICGYTSPSVGIRVNANPAATVDAQNVSWAHAAPILGTDYAVTGTNAVTAGSPCAVQACP
jgi:hypothetical protein